MLDFGRPAYNGTYYGVELYGGGGFATFAQIQAATEAYALGYWDGTYGHSKIISISIGTNNSYIGANCGTCTDGVPASLLSSYGTGWGHMVNNVQAYMNAAPALTTEYADGGIDAEPGYDPAFTSTSSLVTGFNGGSSRLMIDYGTTDGSPTHSTWTAPELYDISWGAGVSGYQDEVPVGETKTTTTANEWAQLYQWGQQNHGSYALYGIMVQCLTSCSPTNLDYATAWTDTLADLSGLGYPGATISWTTDIGEGNL